MVPQPGWSSQSSRSTHVENSPLLAIVAAKIAIRFPVLDTANRNTMLKKDHKDDSCKDVNNDSAALPRSRVLFLGPHTVEAKENACEAVKHSGESLHLRQMVPR